MDRMVDRIVLTHMSYAIHICMHVHLMYVYRHARTICNQQDVITDGQAMTETQSPIEETMEAVDCIVYT